MKNTPDYRCLPICRGWHYFFALLFVACIWIPTSHAQNRNASSGDLIGAVRNSQTRAFLEGAEVRLQGTSFSAKTGRDGSFTMAHVPVGTYTLNVFYTGLGTTEMEVTILADQTQNVAVGLNSDFYALEAFTVQGQREGNAASLTKQRNADNVVNIVSMDTYGNVADGNIGNFLQRLSGVSANKEAGEIVGIGLRGTPPELSAITLDGVRTASAIAGSTPQGDRAPLIDQIPSEFIKEIEVVKANTPDMPADSLGGSINLVTKSAYDFDSRVITYRAGLTHNTARDELSSFKPSVAASYMSTFGEKREWALAVSASYMESVIPRDKLQLQHAFTDGRNSRARTLDDINERTRAGLGTKLEYKMNDTLKFFIDGHMNYFAMDTERVNWQASASGSSRVADYSVVSRAAIEAGATPRATDGQSAGIAPGFTDLYTELLNASWVNQAASEKKRSYQSKIGGGFEKTWDNAKLNVSASYNPSRFDNNFWGFTTSTSGIGLSIDSNGDITRPVYRQTYGPSIAAGADFSDYTGQRFEQPDYSREEVTSLRADYQYDLADIRFPVNLKTGFDYRRQHRESRLNYRPAWNYVGADGVAGSADDNIGQFVKDEPGYGVFNNLYPQRDELDLSAIDKLFVSTPANFSEVGTRVSSVPAPTVATEEVLATYLQGKVTFGDLSVLGGVRVEQTQVESQGSLNDPQAPNETTISEEEEYQKVFPSIHFRYEALRGLLLHASYSTSSARPALKDIVPNTTINYGSSGGNSSVTQNNPGLKPQYSKNFDVSLEYYFEPSGVLSVGWFQKDVTDFIGTFTDLIGSGVNNGFGGDYEGFDLITTQNIGQATIEGYELNYNQQLRFLPGPFKGLSVFANYTKLKTSGTYEYGRAELSGFVPETYNFGGSFSWHQFEVQVSHNYKSAYLLSNLTANPTFRTFVTEDPTWDINLQYKWSPALTFYVDFLNIFNDSPSWYTLNDQRIDLTESYGSRLSFGISGRF